MEPLAHQPPPDAHVPPAPAAPTTDAIVAGGGGLVFVTTGGIACARLGAFPDQVALTPVVALRIGEVLRVVLQYPDLGSRVAILDEWRAGESLAVPHGRVVVDEAAAHVGIEPLGAGTLVSVLWEHVPGFVWQIEYMARQLQVR